MKVLPPITKDEYQQMEIYFHRLSEFTNSDEYLEMPHLKRISLDKEINYISMTLDILFRLFTSKGEKEIPVVAWKIVPGEGDKWKRLYFFSSSKVAALALSVNRNKISQVISGSREHTGKYKFMHAKRYYENQDFEFDPTSKNFNIGRHGRDVEHANQTRTDTQPVLSDVVN